MMPQQDPSHVAGMQLKDILVALGGNALLQRGEPPLPEIQARSCEASPPQRGTDTSCTGQVSVPVLR